MISKYDVARKQKPLEMAVLGRFQGVFIDFQSRTAVPPIPRVADGRHIMKQAGCEYALRFVFRLQKIVLEKQDCFRKARTPPAGGVPSRRAYRTLCCQTQTIVLSPEKSSRRASRVQALAGDFHSRKCNGYSLGGQLKIDIRPS